MSCIDINNVIIKQYSKELNLPRIIVGSFVSIYQRENNTLNFPSIDEIKSIAEKHVNENQSNVEETNNQSLTQFQKKNISNLKDNNTILRKDLIAEESVKLAERVSSGVYNQELTHERTNQIKQIFEQNPELANTVYEALGFKEKRNSDIEELLVVDENEISKKEGESFAEMQKRVTQNINIRKRIEIANKNNIVQGKSYSYYEIKEIFNNDELFDNEIYKQLSTILQSSNLVFKFGSLNQGKKTINAYYNSINNSINIDTLVLQTPNLATSDFKRILLHEIIHAATFINLKEDATLTNTQKTALNNLNNLITELNRDKDFFAQYGLTNANELLAELANERFVDKLKKKTFKDNQSFFDKIISEIVKLLGLNTTAYDIVKESFDNLVKEYKGINQITPKQKQQAQLVYSQYLNTTNNPTIQGFKNFVQGKQFQKLTAEEKAKTIEQVTKEQDNSLFGLNTQNQEQLEFHINTLNVVSKFLENVGVEQRLVSEFLSQDGSIVDGALAAANFIEGTIDIIDDINKRPSAWNKLPEEAAHWWYRLLNENSPLKKALWESHQTALKNDELYQGEYGKLVSKPEDLTEESIGQLIAEAIKRIETKNGNAADYSFFKKLLEWINSIINIFKDTKHDPFEVAAMKILSSDMSDLMTWEEYRKLNNIVNFADVVTEQSVAPLDYTLIEDIGDIANRQTLFISNTGDVYRYENNTFFKNNEEIISEVSNQGNTLSPRQIALDAFNNRNLEDLAFVTKDGKKSPIFKTREELDLWVYQNYGNLLEQRQKQILQEVRDNQIFFDRLLNKTFRKKSKFLPKTLRKYFDIIDAQNLNPLREWNISQELQQITKKLSEQEKKQIIETNGYTNIAPTLKVLPDLLQKYGRKTTPEIIKQEIEITNKLVKKEITKEQATELRQKLENKKKGNPIVLSEPIKIDGAKKQELSILNGIREMIKLENPNLKSITVEEFVAEAHNWLETNYLLGFANEKSYLSYRTDQTFQYLSDRQTNEDVDITNLTEEELQRLPLAERQRIANIVGLTKQNPDVYHNKVSLRFNDMYHLKSGHFDKSPSAWGNLTYFYTGKNKWKDAVLLHEIQNDNIEFLREFKAEKVDLETSLGRYLQQLNTDLLDNITQIESGGKRIQKKIDITSKQTHIQLNYQLQQIKDLPLEQGLQQLKQRLSELIELHKSDSSKDINKAKEYVDRAYSKRRIFQDFQRRGGIKSLLTKQELEDLKDFLQYLNNPALSDPINPTFGYNQFDQDTDFDTLKDKKRVFKSRTIELQAKITRELQKMYGDNAPLINLTAPAKPLPKSQRNMRTVGHGQNQRRIGGASQELNENVNWLLAYSEKKILNNLSKNIEATKKNYIFVRNANAANNFNVALSKITPEQYATLIDNYKYNEDLLNRLVDEQAQKDIQKETKEYNFIERIKNEIIEGSYDGEWVLPLNENRFSTLPKELRLNFRSESKETLINNVKEIYEKWKKDNNITSDKEARIFKQKSDFETLKQKALDKKAELEKNYGKIEEEVKQTLEIEMNYFTPLVHHLIQKHINQYGKDFPMYFSGYQITKLTQGNDRTAWIYAGKDEIDIVDKSLFEFNNKEYKQELPLNDVFQTKDLKTSERKQYWIIKNPMQNTQKYILKTFDDRGKESFIEKEITEQEYNKAKQEYEKAYQQATERGAKEIKFLAGLNIGLYTVKDFPHKDYTVNTRLGDFAKILSNEQLEEGIKKLNDYKKQSKQNLDRVINTIMNISNNKPIETGAIYNAMSQVSGIKLIWQDKIEGLQGNAGGYLVDLTNYNYNTPILYGLNTSKVVPINPNLVGSSEIQYSKKGGVKPGVQELFESNFLIFAESKTSDEVISKLLSNKIIDKKCN